MNWGLDGFCRFALLHPPRTEIRLIPGLHQQELLQQAFVRAVNNMEQ